MHRCLAFYFQKRQPPALPTLLHFYHRSWSSLGYDSPEAEERDKALGAQMLAQFWNIHTPAYPSTLATEAAFLVPVDGVWLKGYIDRVELSPRGGLRIIDYKTGKAAPDRIELEMDLQLSLYQLAAQRLWLLPMESLVIYHLRLNQPFECPPRGQESLAQVRRTLAGVWEGIARARFQPRLNRFCPCDYPGYCPHFA